MAKLMADVITNYIDILSNTIPRMISGASPGGRIGAYLATAALYPLALVVLLVLVTVAAVAVFVVHPLIGGGGNSSE